MQLKCIACGFERTIISPLLNGYVCDASESCVIRQLDNIKLELKRTQAMVEFWKNAWHETRKIIGKLWWHHPAIDNDEQRAYYQNVQKQFALVKQETSNE